MSTAHTPGPWQYDTFEGGPVAAIVEPDGTHIADISTLLNSTAHSALAVNARLIAAAPELLAALQALVGEADLGELDHDDDTRALLDTARAAIERATGVPL